MCREGRNIALSKRGSENDKTPCPELKSLQLGPSETREIDSFRTISWNEFENHELEFQFTIHELEKP
jgi:hypothetical protein